MCTSENIASIISAVSGSSGGSSPIASRMALMYKSWEVRDDSPSTWLVADMKSTPLTVMVISIWYDSPSRPS